MRQQAPPNLTGQPRNEFRKNDFDATIWNKGYDVIVEKAIKCPCQLRGGAPRSDCQNCRGFGWIFVNPLFDRALVTSINSTAKFKAWSLEYMNRVNITLRDVTRLSYFDRITLKDDFSDLSENLTVKTSDTSENFIFTSYEIQEIFAIFKYIDSSKPLVQISKSDYTVDKYKIVFKNGVVNKGEMVSVTYSFMTQYNVFDITHDIRSSKVKDTQGNDQNIKLPIMVVAQKSHTIPDRPNFDGTGVINNSWK